MIGGLEIRGSLPLRDPRSPNVAERRAGPSKTNVATCSTCFIRSRSGSVLRFPRFAATGKVEETWAERDDTANTAIIGHAHDDNSRRIGKPPTLAGYCCIVNRPRCELGNTNERRPGVCLAQISAPA